MDINFIHLTDIGKRQHNTDVLISEKVSNDCFVSIMADGCFDTAISYHATNEFCKLLLSELSESKIDILIDESFSGLNELIKRVSNKTFSTIPLAQRNQVRWVFAMVMICKNHVMSTHIGDCRIYRLLGEKVVHTQDHTVCARYKQGNETLTRVMKYNTIPNLENEFTKSLEENERIILCSDGFWSKCKPFSIENILNNANATVTADNVFNESKTQKLFEDNASLIFLY